MGLERVGRKGRFQAGGLGELAGDFRGGLEFLREEGSGSLVQGRKPASWS